MRAKALIIGTVAATFLASPASAISNGQIDGTAHPNVAAVVFQDSGGEFFGLCGSSLLSPTVLLTTAHCAADARGTIADGGKVWASFDPNFDPGTSPLLRISSAAISPDFNPVSGLFDIGILRPAAPITGITPVRLPTARQLDSVKNGGNFTVVGYGVAQDCSGAGPCMASFDGVRRYAKEKAIATDGGGGIEFQMNRAATGLGGTCYGDGGDPNFIGDTNVEGAVQDGHAGFGASNSPCHSIGFGFRLDTRQARSFLANYVTVP